MIGKTRFLCVVIALGLCPWCANAQGTSEALPRSPVPIGVPQTTPADNTTITLPPPANLPGPPPLLYSSPPVNPYQDNNGPLLKGDPLLDRPEFPAPGWFAALDIALLVPHVKDRLISPVGLGDGFTDTVHLGGAALDWAGSPRLELGYRLSEGAGEFLLSYRFLVTEGHDNLAGFDLDGSDAPRRSRLNMNVVDFDYASREFSLLPHFDMKWKVGARLASVFFDSTVEGFFIAERTSNNFFGGGPHVGLDLWYDIDRLPGLGWFTRMEASSVVGQVHQSFAEVFEQEDGSLVGGAAIIHKTQAVPTLNIQTGLSWTRRHPGHWSRLAFGYEFENWWYVGEAADSRGAITLQGVFFRGEFGF